MLQKTIISYRAFLLLAVTSCCYAVRNIVIDTDAGTDDAMAILLLLRAESDAKSPSPFKVVAITCTYGNTYEENVETNVLKILTIANRSDIPVYAGAKKPLIEKFSTDNVFGNDGFGDAEFNGEIVGDIDRSKHASIALIELSKQYEGNLSVVVLGPTTNVALAASLDNDFTKRIKSFHLMGSSVSGYGNLRPNVEFNFGADPESNHILLDSSVNPDHLTLFPWETVHRANVSRDWRVNVFGKYKSKYIDFLNAIEDRFLNAEVKFSLGADPMTVVSMLRPEIVLETLDASVEAVTDGAARGSILVGYRPVVILTKPDNARIIQKIDVEEFKRTILDLLSCERIEC